MIGEEKRRGVQDRTTMTTIRWLVRRNEQSLSSGICAIPWVAWGVVTRIVPILRLERASRLGSEPLSGTS